MILIGHLDILTILDFLKILDSLKLLDTLKIWNIVDFLGNVYVLVKTHTMKNLGLICLDG